RFDYERAGSSEPGKEGGNGQVTMAAFKAAADGTPVDFYRNLVEDIDACINEFDQLRTTIENKCGRDHAPPSSKIRESLDGCKAVVEAVARKRLDAPSGAGPAAGGGSAAGGDGNGRVAGEISNRREALATVQRLADFFKEREPL